MDTSKLASAVSQIVTAIEPLPLEMRKRVIEAALVLCPDSEAPAAAKKVGRPRKTKPADAPLLEGV